MYPYRVEVAQESIDDLHRRLDATRWPARTPDVGWERGVPLDYLRGLVSYWRTSYDWRATEAKINAFPQFVTTIDGAVIHFVHVRSPEPHATPMLMTTGWPGSIVEYLDVIGPLTNPRAHGGDPRDAYHLVIPSLPGFGFSTPLTTHGWTVSRVAEVWKQLMSQLGHDRYIVQGADWGSFVSIALAASAPDDVAACHLNFLVTPPSGAGDVEGLADSDLALLDRYMLPAPGYIVEHATRPQTMSYGLTDSPVGQLAWNLEKFYEWSGAERDPEEAIDRDALLANITLYWLTGTAGTAAHFYCDNALLTGATVTPYPEIAVAHPRFADHRPSAASLPHVEVPVGVALYPADIMRPIRSYTERVFSDIVHWNDQPHGGHFPGLETPELFVDDLRSFHATLRTERPDALGVAGVAQA